MGSPTRLRVEHLHGDVLGLGVRRPRLSWWLPDGTVVQNEYEIECDDGRTSRVESGRHVLVPWPFEELRARSRRAWRVRVWTDAGPSDWSRPARIELGLLEPDDWSASWIEPDEGDRAAPGQRPVWLLRKRFDLEERGATARLYATAHGVYETFLNGARVGDLELTPGFTSYATNLQVQTFDVTDHLVDGANVWEVSLSDGWYRGRQGNEQAADSYGDTLAFLGQLEVGSTTVVSGAEWEASTGPIVHADLMAGQYEDRRIEPGPWRPVIVAEHALVGLTTSPSPPVRRVQEIRPRSVTALEHGAQIIDLGQNINGWLRLERLGPEGADVVLRHGEALDASGGVTTTHLEPTGRPLGQVDRVISAGRPRAYFEPRHTVHGFQFVQVDGHPEVLTPDDATGVVVHTDLTRTGWFRCSDDRIDRLHAIADWSFRSNACDIPTDCPQRERSGWTGDWQLFQPTAAFLYDVAGFSTKWLRDLAADQLPDGLLPNFAPDPRQRRSLAGGDRPWLGLYGSAGWGDACVLVPWDLYQLYGDEDVLIALWPTMRRWLAYVENVVRTQRHPTRAERRPEPAAHEALLWDAGWQWGEWCEPASDGEPWWAVDQGHVATAYLHRTASIAATIGRILGEEDEARRLERLATGALHAWQAEYVADDGSLLPDTQANHVRALAFGLVPPELRAQTAGRLVELVREAGTHVGTGFLATPHLLPALADNGYLDVAYDLLFQDTPPSWLAMVERGATTVWEEWEGVDADGVPHASLNHYSKGAVISFLHRYLAGIRPIEDELAYRRFRIAPQPGGGITWAEGRFDSPHGRIESSWRIEGGTLRLTVAVPPGTTAEVVLPGAAPREVGPGTTEHVTVAPSPVRGGPRRRCG